MAFGLENPKLGDTFETSASKYEYKMKGGRLQPVRIGSSSKSSSSSGSTSTGIVDTTRKVSVDPSKGGSIQQTYRAGDTTPSLTTYRQTSDSQAISARSARKNNGVDEIYVNGKWIPRTPLTSEEAGFPSITNVTSLDNANKTLDEIQNTDFNGLEQFGAPPDKTTLTENIQNSLDYYSKILSPDSSKIPAFNAETKLEDLRSQYGVEGLEEEINLLNSEEEQILANLRNRSAYQRGKAVSTGVIAGRVSEIERQEMERLDYIRRQKQTAQDQLKTKYNSIQQMMDAAGIDYQNAEKKYNQQFSQNLQLMGIIRGIERDALSDREKAQDNAKASLQILFNNLSEGGLSFDSLSPDQQLEWQKLETQAGLPTGTIQQVSARNPEGKIISTSTRQQGNTKYFDAIMQNPDGSFRVETVQVGSVGSPRTRGGGTSAANKVQEAVLNLRGKIIEDGTYSVDNAMQELMIQFGDMTPDQAVVARQSYFGDLEE